MDSVSGPCVMYSSMVITRVWTASDSRDLRNRPQRGGQRARVGDLPVTGVFLYDELHHRERVVAQDDLLSRMVFEVDHHVHALARGDHEIVHRQRSRKQALIGTDLLEALAAGKRQVIEPRIGSVQHPEAVLARLGFQIRRHPAVHRHHIAEDFRNPRLTRPSRRRITETPVAQQEAVAENERDFELSLRQIQRIFFVIPNDIRAGQARINIQPVDAHGMIVIPQHGRILLIRIKIGRGFSGNVPIFGPAVAFGRDLRAVNVDDRADFGLIGFGAVQAVVDGQKVLGGKLVGPFDQDPLPRRASIVGPGHVPPKVHRRVGGRSRCSFASVWRMAIR